MFSLSNNLVESHKFYVSIFIQFMIFYSFFELNIVQKQEKGEKSVGLQG